MMMISTKARFRYFNVSQEDVKSKGCLPLKGGSMFLLVGDR